jgi:hypothetical protein
MVQQSKLVEVPAGTHILVNGQVHDADAYFSYHQRRIAKTIETLHEIGARKIVEVGAHPWVMTARLIDDPAFELCATVSAEEVTNWPDDIGVSIQRYAISTTLGNQATFNNYSANIERTRFGLQESPDTVVASEIVEHLTRSPHIMFLNINHWLPLAGKLLVTTPNGAQFANPLRRKSSTPAYRCNTYERHSYVYTLDDLVDLITLCGFKIVDAGYWNVYRRTGPSSIYDLLSSLPGKYFRDKFMKTIFVVAEKERDVSELARSPRVYDPRGDWEFIARMES